MRPGREFQQEKSNDFEEVKVKKKLIQASIIITIISSIGKILGLLRESSLASYFGMSRDTDAFKIAFSIPDIFVSIICVAIIQVFIPVYSDVLKEKNPDRTKRFLNSTYTIVGLTAIVIATVGIIFCRIFIRIIAPGFDSETIDKTVILSLIIFPGTVFYVLSNLTASYLQIHGRFISSSLIWFSYNICIIVSLICFNKLGIICAAFGALVGLIGMLIIQIPSLIKEGFKYSFSLDFRDDGLKKIGISIVPVIIASAFNQIFNIFNRMMASGLDSGSISALDFSYKVAMIIYGVFIASLITVMYPSMAGKSSDTAEFKNSVSSMLSLGGIVTLPLVTLVFLLKVPIIEVLFQRGSFSRADTQITAGVLGLTVLGVVGISYREILNRAFYSLKDTRTPMINGVSAIVLNILLNVFLVRIYKVNGLAIGTAISAFVSAAMLYFRLNRKIGGIQAKVLLDGFVKPLFASLAMGLCIFFNQNLLNIFAISGEGLIPSLVKIAVNSLFGVTIYSIVIFQLNIGELDMLKEKLIQKLNFKRIVIGVKK